MGVPEIPRLRRPLSQASSASTLFVAATASATEVKVHAASPAAK